VMWLAVSAARFIRTAAEARLQRVSVLAASDGFLNYASLQ